MNRLPVALLVCMTVLSSLVAGAAEAGAWPREKGGAFISASVRLNWPKVLLSPEPTGKYYTLYAEYGLTDRLTLGIDYGRSVSGDGKSVVFLRVPLRGPDARLKLAAEFGLGRIDGAAVLRPGLSLGQSFDIWKFNGWLAVDGLAEIDTAGSGTDYKIDMTLGFNLQKDRKLLLQLQTGAPAAERPFARIAQSTVVPIGKNRHLEIGSTYGLIGDETFGFLFGIWQSF